MMIDKEYYFLLCKDAELNKEKYIELAKSQCVKWEYTGWKRYDTTPFWFERNLEPRSPIMESGAPFTYCFNEVGEICFIQSHQQECFERSDNRIINRRYSYGKVDSIEELIFINRMPVKYVEFIVRSGMNSGQEWHFEEEYAYDNKNKLTEIKRTEYWYAGKTVRNRLYQIHYDEYDNLSMIKEGGSIIYSYLSVEQVREIRNDVKRALLAESIETIKKIGKLVENEIICFISIYLHDEPHGPIDPMFQAGLESVRNEQLASGENIYALWNAVEHAGPEETLSDTEVTEKFKLLMQYWQIHSDWSNEPNSAVLANKTWWGESKVLWQEVSMELNKLDWKALIPVTEAFVIYIDEEALDVVNGDLALSVPNDKLLFLESKGLISLS
ncbi:MAG: hypothetical protein K0R57_1666 [Paenibacillaceae bacterium]|jgi:hypothetical protein|nr:hypothetical protein [Paenibacillaceae bacterium]